MNQPKFDLALVGLGPMGENLALNMADQGLNVAVFNRTRSVTEEFLKRNPHPRLAGFFSYESLISSVASPRKIFLLIKTGAPTDSVIEQIAPLLEKEDIIIDMGNSFFEDTARREKYLEEKHIHFIGAGISGGEDGARFGASFMPSGKKLAYAKVKKIFEKIAAKDFVGAPTVSHIGVGGSGHYVKMVHNGIEYAIMQALSEAYGLLAFVGKLKNEEILAWFSKLQKKSPTFLHELSGKLLSAKDDLGKGYLIDKIRDTAGAKGTGAQTVIDALKRGVSTPLIGAAVNARNFSASDDLRQSAHLKISQGGRVAKQKLEDILIDALILIEHLAFAEGFYLISKASKEEKWDIDLSEIARVWQGGCIIRSKELVLYQKIFSEKKNPVSILTDKRLKNLITKLSPNLSRLSEIIVNSRFPAPVTLLALNTIHELSTKRLPAVFIAGLRDAFGAHGYKRVDKTGDHHFNW